MRLGAPDREYCEKDSIYESLEEDKEMKNSENQSVKRRDDLSESLNEF